MHIGYSNSYNLVTMKHCSVMYHVFTVEMFIQKCVYCENTKCHHRKLHLFYVNGITYTDFL
jgi:hypothetical protein